MNTQEILLSSTKHFHHATRQPIQLSQMAILKYLILVIIGHYLSQHNGLLQLVKPNVTLLVEYVLLASQQKNLQIFPITIFCIQTTLLLLLFTTVKTIYGTQLCGNRFGFYQELHQWQIAITNRLNQLLLQRFQAIPTGCGESIPFKEVGANIHDNF